MQKDKNVTKAIKGFLKWLIKAIGSAIVSAVIAIPMVLLLFLNTADVARVRFGLLPYQMKMADYTQLIHDYSTSIDLYSRLENKGEKRSKGSSAYASMILGKLYSREEIADYSVAWEHYVKAMESDDPAVLRECLRFVLDQETLRQVRCAEDKKKDDLVGILSDNESKTESNYLEIVTQLFNKLYQLDTDFQGIINHPDDLTKDGIRAIINQKTTRKMASSYKWEYVSTRTSNDGLEEFVGEEEKLVLVDHWQELVSDDSFEIVDVYKYYRYKKVYPDIKEVTVFDLLEDYVGKNQPSFLSDFGLY